MSDLRQLGEPVGAGGCRINAAIDENGTPVVIIDFGSLIVGFKPDEAREFAQVMRQAANKADRVLQREGAPS